MPAFSIRPFVLNDIDNLAFHANNQLVWEGVRDIFPFPYSKKDAENFIEYALSTKTEIVYAIDIDGEAVGAIGLHLKSDVDRLNGEIGYWLGVKYHGQGIGTQAVDQIVSIAFKDYNLLRVYAEVFSNNPSSARVLEKNGFVLEAKLVKAIIKNSKILDLLIYSKVNPNWKLT
jgi:RimJ/RimL family protein N-acetyltransferase